MFYLKKCAIPDCARSGQVAVEKTDIVCNIHRDRQAKVEVTLKSDKQSKEKK